MDKKTLKASKRKIFGRKVKNLRNSGVLIGNIYGKKIKSEAIQVDFKDFKNIYSEVGETGLFELEVDGEKKPVLIHNIQLNPVSDIPVHVDFLQVDLKEKVEAEVPVELVGESPAEKQSLGTVVQYVNTLKVEALPTDLPEKFEIDTSNLAEVDQAIFVKDIKINKDKVEIKADPEEIVAKVEPPQKVEETPAPVTTEVSPEATVQTEAGTESTEQKAEAPKE